VSKAIFGNLRRILDGIRADSTGEPISLAQQALLAYDMGFAGGRTLPPIAGFRIGTYIVPQVAAEHGQVLLRPGGQRALRLMKWNVLVGSPQHITVVASALVADLDTVSQADTAFGEFGFDAVGYAHESNIEAGLEAGAVIADSFMYEHPATPTGVATPQDGVITCMPGSVMIIRASLVNVAIRGSFICQEIGP